MNTVHDLIQAARLILNDEAGIRWKNAELMMWANAGLTEITRLKMSARTRLIVIPLVPGSAQTLPSNALALIDAVCNVDQEKNTHGRVVRVTERAALDAQNPMWHAEEPNKEVKNVCGMPNDPKRFWCYPPQPKDKTGAIAVVVATVPPEVSVVEDLIPIDSEYHAALLDYVLYRALLKDAEEAEDASISQGYLTAFRNALVAAGE